MSSSTTDDAPRPPSKTVEPTKVNTAPQQASTSPGDGAHIPADQIRDPSEVDYNDPNINVVEVPAEKKRSPTFKEQVFGERHSYNSNIQTDTADRLCQGMIRIDCNLLLVNYLAQLHSGHPWKSQSLARLLLFS
ncbi:uncharacterized protein HD556DRAFT_1392715 [Suillus plorans]|uniref:Uncharacterized protein n=1 Tax=Suillus plorans TaxID=116603 RepID=A0A9P7AIP7_9AGAM|nr:uncharacterized protein HD556DRAFT_1392715 [Suillus plorans]KAG1790312.1 hypothetical protein HD556DRAFT_1392715 [Suillus plorans]